MEPKIKGIYDTSILFSSSNFQKISIIKDIYQENNIESLFKKIIKEKFDFHYDLTAKSKEDFIERESNYIKVDERNNALAIKYKNKPTQIIKLKRLLKSEEIIIGLTSKTELYLKDLLEEDASFTREVVNDLYLEVFNEPNYLVNIIEIMSNLDYVKMQPNNITMALSTLNHKNIAVQEASIASFEKWDDSKNVKYLKNIKLTSDWMKEYTQEVIEYLEGC